MAETPNRLGKPPVRDYRGGLRKHGMVKMWTRLAIEKSEDGKPPPTAGAPELYPNQGERFSIWHVPDTERDCACPTGGGVCGQAVRLAVTHPR